MQGYGGPKPGRSATAVESTTGVLFRLNGRVDLVTPSTAGTFDGLGIFDAMPSFFVQTAFDRVRMFQFQDGGTGSTTVELYYWDTAVWTLIGLVAPLTLAAGGGDNAEVTVLFAAPLTLLAGYRLGAMFTAVQGPGAAAPAHVTVSVF